MTLNSTVLTAPSFSLSSDKRLTFFYKPLTTASVAYEQTQDLVDIFTPGTPQSHQYQCGFIAQSVQQIDKLKHAVAGGQIEEDGKDTIISLSYNTICTYAVEAVQELEDTIKKSIKSR